jgi:type VI secretion system protein ImpH
MEVSSKLVPAPRIGSAASASAATAGPSPAPRLAWTTVLCSDDERLITIPLGCYEVFPAPGPNPFLTAHA